MNSHRKNILRFLARPATAAAALLLSIGLPPAAAAAAGDDGAEVLTRGPVHEAFAETITFKPTEGMMVPRASPALIEELPPDQRPEGDNISWIPGYWAWDDESSGFVWVSGIWRNLPPGRQWMPGYWSESGKEFQWVSGYWADAAVEEIEYLSEPPASIEAGPNSKSPSRDHSWIPGSWKWSESRYRWRPGYWDAARPDWVWVPSYYVRSPRGYIYVDGYYDYNVARRGMIFAPVRFSGDSYSRPDYYYQPSTVISLAVLADHLFLSPRHRHYYFGDYYAPEYRKSGYYASHSYYSGGYGYDPIYAHNRWTHREDDRWERRNEDNFRFYRDNREARPPHTLAAFQQFTARPDKNRRVDAGFVTPLAQFATTNKNTIKLKAVNEGERQQLAKNGREIRDFGDQRRKLGMNPANTPDAGKPGKGEPDKAEPTRIKIPRSPVAAKVSEKAAKEDTPPPRREIAVPDDKPGEKPDPGSRPGVKPKGAPDTEPSDQPGRKPKAEPKDPRRREPKTEPDTDPKPEPGTGPKTAPGRTPKVEPKPDREPKGEPKPEAESEPKRGPKPEPNAEPKREPTPAPKDEPKREPKVEPKREPKSAPKIEPKREPGPAPKIEPKSEPRPAPKVEPKREPKAEPAEKGKGKGKDKDKDKDKDKPRGR